MRNFRVLSVALVALVAVAQVAAYVEVRSLLLRPTF